MTIFFCRSSETANLLQRKNMSVSGVGFTLPSAMSLRRLRIRCLCGYSRDCGCGTSSGGSKSIRPRGFLSRWASANVIYGDAQRRGTSSVSL
ncbi:unnamed protein product [Spodoptera exigua]|nr:unnamed protein product [Spodoptera exigua]